MKEGGGGGGRKETLADKPLGFLPFFPTPSPLFYLFHFSPGGGGTRVFFGWVCAALDSKLAPRSRKNSPKIDTAF